MEIDTSKWPNPIEEPSERISQDDPAFVIDCVGWHTQRPGAEAFIEQTRVVYGVLIRFLQENGLVTREILPDGAPVADEVAIRVGDLTPEGDQIMRMPYSRWLDKIDMGMEPTNTAMLERALKKIRAGKTA